MAGKSAMDRQAEALGVAVDRGVDPEELTGTPPVGGAAKPARPSPRAAGPQAPHGPVLPVTDPDDDMVPIRDAETELMLPRITGGRVIYIGASKRKGVPLKGSMVLEQWEIEPAQLDAAGAVLVPAKVEREESPSLEHGIYSYDFSTHDNRGKLIVQGTRLIQPTDRSALRDQRLRYKAVNKVEHPEHLRVFHRMRDANGDPEFLVEVPRREQARFQRWVQERERQLGREQSLIEYTTKD